MKERIAVRRGSLHLEHQIYERYFAPLTGVVLLRDGGFLAVMPVRLAGAGGHLVKIRNAAGDRVIDAADFFRSEGVDDGTTFDLEVDWDEARGALVAANAF
jgi:hypothetical protein